MLAQANRRRLRDMARTPWPFLAGAALLAGLAVTQISNANGGVPAVPLDDSYIHFQFARAFAVGKPFVYSPGGPPVAGATSLLWPLLLALPLRLGVEGLSIIPWAWGLAFLALGLLAYEAARAAERVTDEKLAWWSGVLVLAFSANTWFAASGMESVPFAFLLMRCARRASEWIEGDLRGAWELLLIALLTPAMRPEGILGSVLVAVGFLFGPRGRERLLAPLALALAAVPALGSWFFTGQATQTTTIVKWLPLNPYLTATGVLDVVRENVRLLFSTLLDGEAWSRAFIPSHSRVLAALALPALIVAGRVRNANARATLLALLGLGMLLPTTYDSFLWNRLRYLWPFAAPFLVGLVALADQIGEILSLFHARLRGIRFVLGAAFTLALASKFPFALADLSLSAHAISSQQVALGKWAEQTLDADARIGVNDTGAIAYISRRPIFDIVGLTTAGEARYWAAGAGSRFEHYEHLPHARRPSWFIVYPAWFAIPQLLGECAEERTVHATILGGETMMACAADYARLGSGEAAQAPEFWRRTPLDTLDVADLESEAEHGYALLPATQADDVVVSDGVIVDGMRRHRRRDAFEMELAPRARFVARLGSDTKARVALFVGGRAVASWTVSKRDIDEHALSLPSDIARGRAPVEVRAESGTFGAAHYWVYEGAR